MARRATRPEPAEPVGAPRNPATNGDNAPIVRRAPFSDNPVVGARGLRTQQRILDAALELFGELGYDRCSLEKISKSAGCSRVSVYQYFSDKEDVFRHLAGQVARQLSASTEALEPITPDQAGWTTLRAWVGRYSAIYQRYEPVFSAFPVALESDQALVGGSARVSEHHFAQFQSKLTTTALPPRQLEPVVALLLTTVTRSLEIAGILRSAVPDSYEPDRVADAITQVLHRSLFGMDRAVNAGPDGLPRPGDVPLGSTIRGLLSRPDITTEHSLADKPALGALLEAGHDVFVLRGYHGARVDDIAAAAGVSRGAFYRYFENRDALAQELAGRALRTISGALGGMPPAGEWKNAERRTNLRRWLRRYNQVHVNEAAMVRVWVDAALQDSALQDDSAAGLDWGRRRMVQFLEPRGFGDVAVEGLVMLALIDVFGGRARPPRDVDATARLIVEGFLGDESHND